MSLREVGMKIMQIQTETLDAQAESQPGSEQRYSRSKTQEGKPETAEEKHVKN